MRISALDEDVPALFIGLFVDDGQGGDSLGPETMAKIAALDLTLELDIYAGWE